MGGALSHSVKYCASRRLMVPGLFLICAFKWDEINPPKLSSSLDVSHPSSQNKFISVSAYVLLYSLSLLSMSLSVGSVCFRLAS